MNHHLISGNRAETPGTTPSLLDTRQAGTETQSAEAVAAQAKADRLSELEAKAFDWIARGREANIELGRVFNQIKNILEHGEWEPYFAEKFEPRGVAFRTGQHYMKLAREAEEVAKNANFALFPQATDPQAQAINDAAEQAKLAVANAAADPAPTESEPKPKKQPRKSRPRLDGLYHLPLWLTGDQKDNLDALRKSQNWLGAELAIRATIDRVLIQYGYVNDPPPAIQGEPQSRKWLDTLPETPYESTDDDLPCDFFTSNVPAEAEPEYEDTLA